MVLGRLTHYALDIVFFSTVLAGVKRHTGMQVATTGFPEGPARQTADTILGVGDKVFDLVAATSYTSSWFEREPPQPRK
ncbi:mitofissin [Rhodotorula paludigena]|uniref:mitofissin n=1 Tax=Rhodotorula paludigena TaxID=86838 RepID=UPI0031771B8F